MSKIEDKITNGYRLNLALLYQETMRIFKKSVLVSGLILLLVAIVLFVIYALSLFAYFETPFPTQEQIEQLSSANLSTQQLLKLGLIQSLVFAFLGVLSAGLLRLCKEVDQQKVPTLEAVFKIFFQKEGWRVFIFTLFFQIALSGLTFLFDSLNIFLASWFVMVLGYTLFILVIPLITFENFSLGKAIFSSVKLVNQQPLLMLSLVMFNSVFALSGIFFLLVGIFITFPIWYAFTYSLYKQLA